MAHRKRFISRACKPLKCAVVKSRGAERLGKDGPTSLSDMDKRDERSEKPKRCRENA
tara:strand:- start:883 stop:1053 length:171 start_codon:yes stop_codon:yes gene_type:complete